ncbi:serine/threonine protein phosphatase [Lentibacter algarum]|uniref:metallophosphoesterase family protein n=1 Tax=Lentibacter algarum TaxID=576131 RepID=UPI001C07AB33|nr:metallophosphoesterase family protein [Lentibacter algarum]MBU2981345.1 serine/threonine protein phosphatase [Lentibacter algarum]
MSETIYAIGDIHGQHELLLDALSLIEMDGGPDARVISLGDLVDRGPDSRGVIDTLMNGINAGRNWTVLLGNHDRMFENFMRTGIISHPKMRPDFTWLHERLGGLTTLASYGIDATLPEAELRPLALEAVPEEHRSFLASLPLYAQEGDCVFVHAGIQPKLPLKWQSEDDLIWIRDAFLNFEEPHEHLVVHGHTAVDAPEHMGNRVNIDSGAGFGRALTTVAIEGRDVFVLEEDGRIPLTPSPSE